MASLSVFSVTTEMSDLTVDPVVEPQKRRAIWNQTLSQIFSIFRIG